MKLMSSKVLRALALTLGCLAVSQTEAAPGGRSIYLNGLRMSPTQVVALDALNCGAPVPNGRYWVNWQTRAWGYEGGPRQGWIQNCQRQAQAPTEKRFIEDRVFERYGVDMIHMPTYR